MKKKIFISLCIAFISLLILEVFLRIYGFNAWRVYNYSTPITVYDEKLGWKVKRGTHFLEKSIKSSKETIEIKVENNDNRKTLNKNNNKNNIMIIGGSFSFGSGVSDDQTYAYKLDKLLPKFNIYNFGQPGYGTIQSIIILNEKIKKIENVNLIIYGFIDHHIQRNVARSAWLEVLSKAHNENSKFKPSIPYGEINKKDETLTIKPLISYSNFPLKEYSALITVVEKIYMKQISRHRKKGQLKVLIKSIEELNRIAVKNENNFLVVNLDLKRNDHDVIIKKSLKKKNISYLDCRTPNFENYKLKNDYHPNSLGHEFYSICIYNFLKKKDFLK